MLGNVLGKCVKKLLSEGDVLLRDVFGGIRSFVGRVVLDMFEEVLEICLRVLRDLLGIC